MQLCLCLLRICRGDLHAAILMVQKAGNVGHSSIQTGSKETFENLCKHHNDVHQTIHCHAIQQSSKLCDWWQLQPTAATFMLLKYQLRSWHHAL